MPTLNKKAQEEIVGFVVIVVIVSIALVIVLGIMLANKENKKTESIEIYQFLESAMQYTTSCALSYEPAYLNLGELLQKCHEGISCLSGKRACEIFNQTIREMIVSSYQVGEESARKGYNFKAVYATNKTKEEFISIEKGICNGIATGSEILLSAFPGTISAELRICF